MAARRPPLGQHFLHDSAVLSRVASEVAAAAGEAELLVEIGAGTGALTRRLAGLGKRLLALEIDPRLVRRLRAELPAIEVIQTDVLAVDLRQLILERTARPAAVAGNLPYYITAPILRSIFGAGEGIAAAVLLMQKEVAERVTAEPGSRDYGYLSVLCQAHSRPHLLLRVPPDAFRPRPKVTSALVRLTIEPRWAGWGVQDRPGFLEFAQLCFRQKRKTLRNNLEAKFGKQAVSSLPEAGLRAEQLPPEALAALWIRLKHL